MFALLVSSQPGLSVISGKSAVTLLTLNSSGKLHVRSARSDPCISDKSIAKSAGELKAFSAGSARWRGIAFFNCASTVADTSQHRFWRRYSSQAHTDTVPSRSASSLTLRLFGPRGSSQTAYSQCFDRRAQWWHFGRAPSQRMRRLRHSRQAMANADGHRVHGTVFIVSDEPSMIQEHRFHSSKRKLVDKQKTGCVHLLN